MSIDISKFKEVFLEESMEGLDNIESVLMSHSLDEMHDEEINSIFRSAHTLKGGSATFEYTEVANLTHEMETYLDKIRKSELALSVSGIDLILSSVDCLRRLVGSYHHGESISNEESNVFKSQFQQMLDDGIAGKKNEITKETPEKKELKEESVWKIKFIPKKEFFLTGNEPLRFLRELKSLGDFSVEPDVSCLPEFHEIEADKCYISWDIVLKSDCLALDIQEVFSWVIDECDLTIIKEELISQQSQSQEQTKEIIQKKEKKVETTSIRVSVEKMDNLLNMVGELVITQSMLNQIGRKFELKDLDKLRTGLILLEQNARELQESVMRIRMVPISFIFGRIQRVAYDLSKKCNKEVDIEIFGEQTELDKTVMEYLGDPILHLIRNSIDHGIELAEDRVLSGKSRRGKIRLEAYQQGGNIIIEISDDGKGLDKKKIMEKARSLELPFNEEDEEEIYHLIFQPGFSTAEKVSDVSGRGVGMDVVMQNMNHIGGNIVVTTEKGLGSKFSLQLPLTLAILDGQLCRVGNQIFIIPLASIKESLQLKKEKHRNISANQNIYQLRDEFIPTLKLAEVFNVPETENITDRLLLVVLEAGKQKIGIFVDELLEQQQVVIKSIEENCKKIVGISGATILGNGTVSLIIDVSGMLSIYKVFANRIKKEISERIEP